MTKSDDQDRHLQSLRETYRLKEEEEYAEFLASEADAAGLTSTELENQVSAIMQNFDALAKDNGQAQSTTALITDLARVLVNRLAPYEIFMFDATKQAFFQNPEAVLQPTADQAAGFGAAGDAQALTPAAFYVVRAVVQALEAESDGEQIRIIGLDSARKAGLTEADAVQLVDLLVAISSDS